MPSELTTEPSKPISGRAKICQIVPTTFQGISNGTASKISNSEVAAEFARQSAGNGNAQRHFQRKYGAAEQQLALQCINEPLVAQSVTKPVEPDEVARVKIENVLHRVVSPRSSAGSPR